MQSEYQAAIADTVGKNETAKGFCLTSGFWMIIATFMGLLGATELIAVWTDPDFDASERAFYYARVIEIPTPRWTAYDAVRFGVTPPSDIRMTVTERAYTAPIWYSPAN